MWFRSSVSCVVLFAAVSGASCAAQTYPTYNLVASYPTPGWYSGNTYAVDLNNDGVPDLIQNYIYGIDSQPLPIFAVFIANGDGTFKAPVKYQYPPAGGASTPMAFGDFNGDGNIDIAMSAGNHTVAVYLGRGDGTFANPWYSVVNLPSNEGLSGYSLYQTIVAADFNHDGKLDLAMATITADNSSQSVYLLPGEGNGLFSEAIPLLTYANPGGGGQWGVQQVLNGDFNGDTDADLVIITTTGNGTGGPGDMTVHVLYGDGGFGFTDTTPVINSPYSPLTAGDLDSDGKSDLYWIGEGGTGTNGLHTFYGQSNRTFASYTQLIAIAPYSPFGTAPMADFNDDGHNDLVASAGSFLVFFLATASRGQFILQTWNVPNTGNSPPIVGDFNHDGKPDWAYVGVVNPFNGPTTIAYTGLNSTPGQLWSNCDYPLAGRAINLCSPAIASGSTVNFNAAARSFGDLRKMELWVDGKKLGEQYHTWEGNAFFSGSSNFGPGTHYGTYFAADIDDSLLSYNFQFTIPSSCNAPPTAGVHMCWPVNGVTINSHTVVVQASSTVSGTLARMEVWVDGVKKYTETNAASLSTAVTVSAGTHRFTVFAVSTSGVVWSQGATATIP